MRHDELGRREVGLHHLRVVAVLHPRGVGTVFHHYPHRVAAHAIAAATHVYLRQHGELYPVGVRLHLDTLNRVFQRGNLGGELARRGVGAYVDELVGIFAARGISAGERVAPDAHGVTLPRAVLLVGLGGARLAIKPAAVVVQLQRDGGHADVVRRRTAHDALV